VPASHAPPHLPPHTIWGDVHVERLLGARRGENRWVRNMMNMAYGLTPPVLKSEYVSRCDGLYEVGRCQATDTCQKTTNGVFFELMASTDSEAHHCTIHYLVFVFIAGTVYVTNFVATIFPVFIWMTFVYLRPEVCANPGYLVTVATKVCTRAPNIFGFSVLNLLHVSLLAHRILNWLLDYWKIVGPCLRHSGIHHNVIKL
jgi:hypothetical protein